MTRLKRISPVLLLFAGVITVLWKLILTNQYTFLESPDLANQVMPWLEAQVFSLRHFSILLWDPYEWFGQQYRPMTVYIGFVCTLLGFAVAIALQRRREDGLETPTGLMRHAAARQ